MSSEAIITIATAIGVEYLRKPKLRIQLGKPYEMRYEGGRPAGYMKALNLDVHNAHFQYLLDGCQEVLRFSAMDRSRFTISMVKTSLAEQWNFDGVVRQSLFQWLFA